MDQRRRLAALLGYDGPRQQDVQALADYLEEIEPETPDERAERALGVERGRFERRPSILPLARNRETGDVEPAWPEAAISAVAGVMTPRAAMEGAPYSVENAVDAAGTAVIGTLGASAARGVPARRKTMDGKEDSALRKGSLYTPSLPGLDEPTPGAAFAPSAQGASDVQARAAVDDEGRSLQARYVVGRGLGREAERSLAADEAEALVRGLTGNDPQLVSRSQIKDRADGSFSPGENQIRIADDLDAPFIARALRHEAGHMLDRAVGIVKDDGIRKELDLLFKEGSARRGTRGAYTPRDAGYPERQVRGERIAEAIRIYMEHPAYIKQVAPKAAARIRELVNDHPRVAEWIQFNGIAGLLALGAGASLDAMAGQPAQAQQP